MCRVLAYLGEPISLEHVLFETDSSLVRQSYSPRMMADVPQPRRVRHGRLGSALDRSAEDPFTYRVTTLPGLRPQPAQPGGQARADLPRRARPRRHLQRARDGRRDQPAPVPLPRRARRAGAQRPPARVRAHALRPRPRTSGPSSRSGSRARRTPSGSTRSCSRSSTTRTACPEPRELGRRRRRRRCASCARCAAATASTRRRR